MRVNAAAVIVGGFGLGNFGDDLLMLASIRAVSRAYDASQIAVLIYPGSEDYCRRLDATVQYVARGALTCVEASAVIYGGGTQFFHFSGPAVRRSRRQRIGRFLAALRQRRMTLRNLWSRSKPRLEIAPTAVRAAVSIGLGPFGESDPARSTAELLASAKYLSVRDATSLEYCRQWGFDHAVLRSDFGFARALWSRNGAELTKERSSRQVGIVVRDWYRTQAGHQHLSASLQLAAALRQHGWDVHFFLFDNQSDTTCRDTLRRHRQSYSIWDPRRDTVTDQLHKLADCDLLITARAHGAIVGAVVGVPSICTEIEPKLRIVSESLGSASTVWPQPFDVDQGVSLVESMSSRLDECRREALRCSREHGRSAEQSADELARFLQSHRAHEQSR